MSTLEGGNGGLTGTWAIDRIVLQFLMWRDLRRYQKKSCRRVLLLFRPPMDVSCLGRTYLARVPRCDRMDRSHPRLKREIETL